MWVVASLYICCKYDLTLQQQKLLNSLINMKCDFDLIISLVFLNCLFDDSYKTT